jgi:Domain of unknown function (DUF1905)/Bacteriocin-protection, YdeI or OmpD-Associated
MRPTKAVRSSHVLHARPIVRGKEQDMSEAPATGGAIRFRATVQLGGKTATGIEVPPELVRALGPSRRPPVRATIAGYTYRSSVASMRGRFMLPVSAAVRQGAGVAAGDEVDVELALDTEPREVTLPPDFASVLHGDARATRFFDGLSYSNKQRHVLAIESAKTPETRRRRTAKAVAALREERA